MRLRARVASRRELLASAKQVLAESEGLPPAVAAALMQSWCETHWRDLERLLGRGPWRDLVRSRWPALLEQHREGPWA
jgi:hypothetical protein